MIISIDFDGTIVEDAFPKIGKLKDGAVEYINMLFDEGHNIIINSCRAGKEEGMIYDFLEEVGMSYDFINCNLPSLVNKYRKDCRKISADIYIDDRNLGGLPGTWKEIYNLIHEKYIKK